VQCLEKSLNTAVVVFVTTCVLWHSERGPAQTGRSDQYVRVLCCHASCRQQLGDQFMHADCLTAVVVCWSW